MLLTAAPKKIALAVLLSFGLYACSSPNEDKLLAEANTYINNAQYSKAIISLKSAVQVSPSNQSARRLLAETHFELGNFNDSLKEIDQVRSLSKDTTSLIELESRIYFMQGDYEALSLLVQRISSDEEPVITERVHHAFTWHKIAEILLGEDGANGDSPNLPPEISKDYPYSLLIVLQNESSSAAEKALEFSKIGQISEDNKEALLLSGYFYNIARQPQRAAEALSAVLAAQPNFVRSRFLLADALINAKQYQEAEAQTSFILNAAPKNAYANYLQSYIEFERGEFEDAFSHASSAVQSGFSTYASNLIAGLSAYELEKFEQSFQYLSKVKEQFTESKKAANIYALLLVKLGYYDEAFDFLNDIKEIDGDTSRLLVDVTYEFYKAGNTNYANDVLKRLDGLSLTDSSLKLKRGLLDLSLGNENAISEIRSTYEQNSDSLIAKEALSQAYLETKQFEESLRLAKELQEQGDITGLKLEGLTQLMMGNVDAGEKSLADYLEQNPNDLFASLALAKIYSKSNIENARALIEVALKNHPTSIKALQAYYSVYQGEDSNPAIELASKALEQLPNSQAHKLLLGKMYLFSDKPTLAINLLDVELDKPESEKPVELWLILIDSALRLGQKEEAKRLVQTWYEYTDQSTQVAIYEIILLEQLGELQNSHQALKKLSRKLPDNQQVQFIEVSQLLKLGKASEAEKKLNNYFEPNADNIKLAGLRGQVYYFNKKYKEALPFLLSYYENTGDLQYVKYIYIAESFGRNKTEGANFLERHIKKYPNDVDAYFLLGNHFINSDNARALNYFKKYNELDNSNPIVLNNLAWLEFKNNNLNSARNYIDTALSITDKYAQLFDTAAQIYAAQNNHEEAKQLIVKAKELAPESSDISETYNRIVTK